jgi:hypothetical protein
VIGERQPADARRMFIRGTTTPPEGRVSQNFGGARLRIFLGSFARDHAHAVGDSRRRKVAEPLVYDVPLLQHAFVSCERFQIRVGLAFWLRAGNGSATLRRCKSGTARTYLPATDIRKIWSLAPPKFWLTRPSRGVVVALFTNHQSLITDY